MKLTLTLKSSNIAGDEHYEHLSDLTIAFVVVVLMYHFSSLRDLIPLATVKYRNQHQSMNHPMQYSDFLQYHRLQNCYIKIEIICMISLTSLVEYKLKNQRRITAVIHIINEPSISLPFDSYKSIFTPALSPTITGNPIFCLYFYEEVS